MAGKGSGKGGKGGTAKVGMTPARASAIQSKTAKTGGDVGAGSFAARAQRAGAVNVNTGAVTVAPAKK